MNDHIKILQAALGIAADGILGPITERTILKAAQEGRLGVAETAAIPALPWVAEMQAVFGLHEVRDKAKLAAWLKSDGRTLGDPTALPWCGDAMETAMRRGLPDEPLIDGLKQNPYWARNWAMFGRAAKGYGSIGVFERGPKSGHVGILIGEDADCYHVLGGNQGDSVSVVRIVKTRLIAARWPVTWPRDPDPLPRLTSQVAKSVNEA